MAKLLEVAQLAQRHGVAKVDVGRTRIDTELDAQRPALITTHSQALLEILFADKVDDAALDHGQLFFYRWKLHCGGLTARST
jgi:hypothetical protein